jgi:hypothetical protein
VDNWVDTDLTELTGGKPLAGPASSGKHLVALLTTPNNQRHVYFAAKSGDLEQLYFNGSSWSKQNLTATTHGPGVDTGNFDFWMAACVVNNDQYVFFASPDLHLHEFSYVDHWKDTDLTALTGFTTGGSAAAFAVPGTSSLAVFYSDSNGDVHYLPSSNGKSWPEDFDLTSITGQSASVDGAIGFATTPNDQLHFYTSAASGVNQFYFNGSDWSFQNLPGGSYWEPYGLAGFNVGNEQYVYYLASNPD